MNHERYVDLDPFSSRPDSGSKGRSFHEPVRRRHDRRSAGFLRRVDFWLNRMLGLAVERRRS